MKYKVKKDCRCCGSNNLKLYLDLGKQPLANSYHKGISQDEVPLKVNLCRDCYHNQLSVVVDPDYMFKNYLYISGTTETFRNHTRDLAKNAVSRFKEKNLNVLDVACNDGTQLEYFRQLDCKILGVDPARNLRKITKEKKIDVLVNYWTPEVAKKYKDYFHIITGTNVFAHVDDVLEFLESSKIALRKNGLLILEFPYAENMIANNEFDTVYHEHLSYFLVNSFKVLIDRAGMQIVDVMKTPIHGGSIRFFIRKDTGSHNKKISALIKNEKNKGLLKEQTYVNYSKRILKNKNDMKTLLKYLKSKNKKVIGYGASAKGNTMLNFFKINLDYIVDDNELKWGFYTPGRNIRIKSPEVIRDEAGNLNIVILSWNFYNEIVKKINIIRKSKKDTAILYVPKVLKRSTLSIEKYNHSA